MVSQMVSQAIAARDSEALVRDFSSAPERKELWKDAEKIIPAMIEPAMAKLGDGASAQDILAAAYDMAINADPDLRAKVAAAAAPAPDPKRTEAALRAKSVNVISKSSGNPKPLSGRRQNHDRRDGRPTGQEHGAAGRACGAAA
jgi:hypothetical protein